MSSTQSTAPESPRLVRPVRRKVRLFAAINVLLIFSVILALVSNRYASIYNGLYVVLLFFVCTFPLVFFSNYRGKASLLIIFLAYYFAIFALSDLVGLFLYEPRPDRPPGLLTGAEMAILVGAACFIMGYILTGMITKSRKGRVLGKEWSPRALAIGGLVCWATGFYITALWQFGVGDTYSGAKVNVQLGGFISILRFLQPVGTLLLIYLFITGRNKVVLGIMLATMVLDFGLGFVGDSKELALRAPILYIVSVLLLRERLPVIEVAVFVVIASITFNLFAAYRANVHLRQQSRIEALQDIGSKLDSITGQDKSFAERFRAGRDYFVDRISLKHHVELIVSKVGHSVEYLEGYTLKPLLYAFIPRLVIPDKQDSSEAGRLYNQQFGISGDRNTYISMSQLGELYWNFGWAGIVFGMLVIGAVMGWIASLLRLDTFPTIIKYLLLLMTIYLLTLRFSGALAKVYIVWARLCVLLLMIHFFMPKQKISQADSPAGSRPQVRVLTVRKGL